MTKRDQEILDSIIYDVHLEKFEGHWNQECTWVGSISKRQLKWMIKKGLIISSYGKEMSSNNFISFYDKYSRKGIAFAPDKETELLLRIIK